MDTSIKRNLTFILVTLLTITTVQGHFSLFLNESETRRLLVVCDHSDSASEPPNTVSHGSSPESAVISQWSLINPFNTNNTSKHQHTFRVPGELYYARNGFLNDYALSFHLPLKTDVTDIYFDWQNEAAPSRSEVTMYYSLSVTVSNLHAMYQPTVSIPSNGTVPMQRAGFSISLLCTGLLSTEVDIRIQITVSSVSSNIIIIDLRRRKPCLRGVQQSKPGLVVQSKDSKPVQIQRRLQEDETGVKTQTTPPTVIEVDSAPGPKPMTMLYVGTGCAIAVVLLAAGLGLLLYMSCSKAATKRHLSSPSNEKSLENQEEPDSLLGEDNVRTLMRCSASTTGSNCDQMYTGSRSHHSIRDDLPPFYSLSDERNRAVSEHPLTSIRVEPCRLTLKEVILKGSYSCVYRGSLISGTTLTSLDDQDVLVKTISSDDATEDEVSSLVSQGGEFLGLQHENLNPIIAACTENSRQPLLIYHLPNEGNLKLFLHRRRSHEPLTMEQMMCLAIQLTGAVQYLHRLNITHKDIATRNCFVDNCLSIRLADSALSADVFPRDYDVMYDGGILLPVKWMAIESLEEGTYTKSSDVWSFGVTVWELLTHAVQPFASVESADLCVHLRRGYRLTQPLGCPSELYRLLTDCWLQHPNRRPAIGELQAALHNFCTQYSTLTIKR